MREYFKEQLENAEPLTEESIARLKQGRIDGGFQFEDLNHLVPGDVQLFVLVNHDKGLNEDGSRNLQCNIEKILEREIEDFCNNHNFIGMTGKDGTVPRFESK